MTHEAPKQTDEPVSAWWNALAENERKMWMRVAPGHEAQSAFEIYQREKEAIREARSSGSTAGDRAIGKRHNPYDSEVEPHLRFYWEWLYEETWAHR